MRFLAENAKEKIEQEQRQWIQSIRPSGLPGFGICRKIRDEWDPCVVVAGGEQTTAKTKADPCGMTTKGQATARVTAMTKAVDEELKEKRIKREEERVGLSS